MTSFLTKINTKETLGESDVIRYLIRVLTQNIGNKRYMHDFENLLKRLEPLSSFETETLWYLIRDLKR